MDVSHVRATETFGTLEANTNLCEELVLAGDDKLRNWRDAFPQLSSEGPLVLALPSRVFTSVLVLANGPQFDLPFVILPGVPNRQIGRHHAYFDALWERYRDRGRELRIPCEIRSIDRSAIARGADPIGVRLRQYPFGRQALRGGHPVADRLLKIWPAADVALMDLTWPHFGSLPGPSDEQHRH